MDIPAIYDRLAELAFKKGRGQLSEEEARELNDIIESSSHKKELFEEMMDPEKTVEDLMIMEEYDVEASWEIINQPLSPLRKKWGWVQFTLAAASIVLLIGLGALYFSLEKNKKPAIVQNEKVSSGNTIIMDSVAVISNPDGSVIVVQQDRSGISGHIEGKPLQKKEGFLLYPSTASATVHGLSTIKTLPGKELPVMLDDGTRTWISGNSELSFTDDFASGERMVMLEGEAYFEVVKKGTTPFKVMARGVEAKVLGTKFNVSAYKDQGPVTTSLFDGKIQLSAGDQTMLLLPGEEAIFANNKILKQSLGKRSVNKVEGKKSGKFIFSDDIITILEDVAKNYNCSVEFKNVMPDKTFTGSFSRSSPIHSLLKNISRETGVDLNLQGKTIIADYKKAR